MSKSTTKQATKIAAIKTHTEVPASLKPLWQRFAKMTVEERAAEFELQVARIESGEMTEAEVLECAAAWQQASEWQIQQGTALLQIVQLVEVSGCPEGTPPIGWLLEKGLLVETPDSYELTAKALALLPL
jgi:hypothetical protein